MQNITEIEKAVEERFAKDKELFESKFSKVPNIETFIDAQINRLENNIKPGAILKDFIVTDTFINTLISEKRKPVYMAGWEASINGILDTVSKHSIEDWPQSFIQGASDALCYHWLQSKKREIAGLSLIDVAQDKKGNRYHLALAYYYLHVAGEHVDLRDDIKERRRVASAGGFSEETFYEAYMEYIRDDKAILSLGTKHKATIKSKFDRLNGAIAILKTIPKSRKALELATSHLQELTKKVNGKL